MNHATLAYVLELRGFVRFGCNHGMRARALGKFLDEHKDQDVSSTLWSHFNACDFTLDGVASIFHRLDGINCPACVVICDMALQLRKKKL